MIEFPAIRVDFKRRGYFYGKEHAMLAEKFLLFLETLQSRAGAVGYPMQVSTSPHVPVQIPPRGETKAK